MNTFSGKRRIGLLASLSVLLMPLLGIGTASAIEVNDQVTVLVPDLQEFPAAPEEQIFTCRAITDHAVWLVQDTSAIDLKGGFDSLFVPKIVWGSDPALNVVDPTTFTAFTDEFENNVWGTVTADCGVPTDLNSDGKVVIILAAIPTKYNSSSSSQSARNNMFFADTEFNEIEGVSMEVFYLNIHPLTTSAAGFPSAVDLRTYYLANGLTTLSLQLNDPEEDVWLVDGLASAMQYKCFGLTEIGVGALHFGLEELVDQFAKTPYLELINVNTGNPKYDFCYSRGQRFLWFMYLAQREGEAVISTIAQDNVNSGMLSIALAIDPSADVETAVNDIVVPIYLDWLVCNLHNDFRSDFGGGIYKYDFLEGTTLEDWSHSGQSAPFSLTFNSFPIAGSLPASGMAGPVWASQYCRFNSYDQPWVTYFNGQFSDGSGANSAVNSNWICLLIKCDDETGMFVSVETLSLDSFFNTTFILEEPNTYLIVTNNNPGGATEMKYYISNDTVVPETETAIHQNSIVSQYMTAYSALVDTDTDEIEGYDWVGPIFEASHVQSDSIQNIKMTSFYGGVWTGIFAAWATGNYELSFAGYDSTGHDVEGLKNVAVGFADTDLTLELTSVRLDVPKGGAPNGSMVTLAETGTLGLAIESSASIQDVRGRMTGILVGPVAIPAVTGTLSFASTTNAASVYRYTNEGWVMLDSWLQGGQISATVEEGGIYALGEGIGVFAPEIPAQLVLGANAPNPFSAQTAISFGLPVGGNVRVNVFDMTGRLVTTIANEDMAAANHTIIWDGTDSTGSPVGAGVYFCRLESAGQVLTQKMLKVQ